MSAGGFDGFGGFGGFGLFFGIMPILFVVVFTIVIGLFIVTIVKNIGQNRKNNASPILKVPAVVVTKRTNVSHRSNHHHAGSMNHVGHSSSSTTYYATFEVESGSRMELKMDGKDFGLLAEGDTGMLQFQGTRYLGFDRVVG